MNTDVIYEPKGRAGEYAKLACNIYQGCSNECAYCFAPLTLKKDRKQFHESVQPRKNIVERFKKDAEKVQQHYSVLRQRPPTILFCFTCDPYPVEELELKLTRQCIQIAHEHQLPVQVLTKQPWRALHDFNILGKLEGDSFAVSLTCLKEDTWGQWEPYTESPVTRMHVLRIAHECNIQTWASLEPVIYPEETLELIRLTHEYVDFYKVGMMNYMSDYTKHIDWSKFAHDAVELLESLGKSYMLKNDLKEYMYVR